MSVRQEEGHRACFWVPPGMPTSEVSAPFSIPSNVLSSPDSVPAPEQPLGRPLTPQLNDLFPWAFHCLPGPYQEMFRYQKAVRGYIHREIRRHKLRTSEASKDFISCYLAQIKVGLRGLQKAGGGGEGRSRGRDGVGGGTEGQSSQLHLISKPWPQVLTLASNLSEHAKAAAIWVFPPFFSQANAGSCRHG